MLLVTAQTSKNRKQKKCEIQYEMGKDQCEENTCAVTDQMVYDINVGIVRCIVKGCPSIHLVSLVDESAKSVALGSAEQEFQDLHVAMLSCYVQQILTLDIALAQCILADYLDHALEFFG